MRPLLAALAAVLLLAADAAPASAAATPKLRAGAGSADITPPTGYAFGGWVRADRTGNGAQGRLEARVLVLQRGDRKVALVAADLFAVFSGMVQDIGDATRDLGFDEQNLIIGVTHTHAGPSGFANFDTYNSIAPSTGTVTNPQSFVDFFDPKPTDRKLYTFLVEQIATAVRRANADLAPAVAGWGSSRLNTVTRNRSVEAHLADHGIIKEPRTGSASEDPEGVDHTIDPEVSVLRVDQLRTRVRRCRTVRTRGGRARGGRARRCKEVIRLPLGGWSMFANHGTVNPSEYEVYNQDHHGFANREFTSGVRKEGRVPATRPVVNVYGNGNEGDQSAGLDGQGPAVAARVGKAEGRAMLAAWRAARTKLTSTPVLDQRWTRVCFCDRAVSTGERVSATPALGTPFLTGSEEGRGPLFDITKQPLEGVRNEEGFGSQGHKAAVPGVGGDVPGAVPLHVVRVADRLIVTLPAEPTVEVGRRARAAVLAATKGSGITGVVVQGLTGEFIQYLTTPEEYDRQHYEGGSTLFGRVSAQLLWEDLAVLAGRLVRGQPAQTPFAFDPSNGVQPDGAPFGTGATSGTLRAQPKASIRPGGSAEVGWSGGPSGLDRPVDIAFVTVERRSGGRWERVTDDLDLDIVWRTDNEGAYTAEWQAPRVARVGEHRFVITANRYRLTSRSFSVAR